MKLSIVVPCYNEAKNIPALVAKFEEAFRESRGVEVILVNNGSTDHSVSVFDVELNLPGREFIRLVHVPVNKGYGHGILSGLAAAKGDFLGWTHADLQTEPADLLRGFTELQSQVVPDHCFLRGQRIGRNFFDATFTMGMSVIASIALKCWLHDINAQPKIFHRSFYKTFVNPPADFSLDLFVLYQAKQKGLSIVTLPVNFGQRVAGEAKGGGTLRGKYKLIKRTFSYILALRRELRSVAPATIPAPQQSMKRAA
ncbi:MAG: glycosyltransferase family 2 protein [Gemmataceae bacterium]